MSMPATRREFSWFYRDPSVFKGGRPDSGKFKARLSSDRSESEKQKSRTRCLGSLT